MTIEFDRTHLWGRLKFHKLGINSLPWNRVLAIGPFVIGWKVKRSL